MPLSTEKWKLNLVKGLHIKRECTSTYHFTRKSNLCFWGKGVPFWGARLGIEFGSIPLFLFLSIVIQAERSSVSIWHMDTHLWCHFTCWKNRNLKNVFIYIYAETALRWFCLCYLLSFFLFSFFLWFLLEIKGKTDKNGSMCRIR